jgi:hypothetical protein
VGVFDWRVVPGVRLDGNGEARLADSQAALRKADLELRLAKPCPRERSPLARRRQTPGQYRCAQRPGVTATPAETPSR